MTISIKHQIGNSFFNVIILICLVGFATSFAVTNLYKFIEFSRCMEALSVCKSISDTLNYCKMSKLTYVGCASGNAQLDEIIKDPERHFDYDIESLTRDEFTIIATRNMFQGGDGGSQIIYKQTKTQIIKSGTGVYIYIQ